MNDGSPLLPPSDDPNSDDRERWYTKVRNICIGVAPGTIIAFVTATYHSLQSLRVTEVELPEGAGIRITGQVRSYYHKQLAQELARKVKTNGQQIVNDVEVIQTS